jgi:hypothetical protein
VAATMVDLLRLKDSVRFIGSLPFSKDQLK